MSAASKLLEAELRAEFEKLEGLVPGSEEHTAVANTAAKLFDRIIELEKLETETQHKEAQLRIEKVNNIVKNILTGIGTALSFGVAVWGTLVSMDFERTGTVTTTAGKQHLRDLFRFRK